MDIYGSSHVTLTTLSLVPKNVQRPTGPCCEPHRAAGQGEVMVQTYQGKFLSKHGDETKWIGFREILQETPIFNGKIDGFRLRFSLTPIQ